MYAEIGKKMMIESQTSMGRCYVRLLATLPNYKACDPADLESAIVFMTQELGANPFGSDVLTELMFANLTLAGKARSSISFNDDIHKMTGEFTQSLFSSGVRFGVEEISGVKHISHFIMTDGKDETVYNDFGWSTKYVLVMMCVNRARVGAGVEVDLDDLFAGLTAGDDDGDYVIDQTFDRVNDLYGQADDDLKMKIDDQYNEIEKLNSIVKVLESKLLASTNEPINQKNNKQTGDMISDLLQVKLEKMKINQKYRNQNDGIQSTVSPLDSSSQLSRYRNQYMENGTILTLNKNNKTVLSAIHEGQLSLPTPLTIARGYVKTQEMLTKETLKLKNVSPINGLSIPFKSHRLNLLCHFHTAIDSIMFEGSLNMSVYDTLLYLFKYKAKTPSEELAFRMITDTFDMEDQSVHANPYKIPFLEIGMLMSDDCLMKAMDMLRLEYKMLWFEEMKSLRVPVFHDEYRKYKENKITANNTKRQPTRSRSRKSPPGSTLSVLKNSFSSKGLKS